MDEKLKENLTSWESWMRGLYMLLFFLIFRIAEIVIAALAVFQFIATLLTGKTNLNLLTFGQKLSTYIYQIMLFFTYNSEEKPFPFSSWPQGLPETQKKKPEMEKAGTKKTGPKPKRVAQKVPKEGLKSP